MFNKFRRVLKNHKGFTLVELMVVVVIIGILVAIAVPVYSKVTGTANRNAVEANLRTIDGAIAVFEAGNPGVTPTNGGATGNLVGTYLQAWPTGPSPLTAGSYKITGTIPNCRAAVTMDANIFGDNTAKTDANMPITWK